MEPEGLPKKNIILAAALAFGFYFLWSALVPKFFPAQARPSQAPQAAQTPAAAQTQATPRIDNISFVAWGEAGKINLAHGAAIAELRLPKIGETAGETVLAPGSAFLETSVPAAPDSSWTLQPDPETLRLELPVPGGLLIKEYEFTTGQPGFGMMRLRFQGDKKTAVQVNVGLSAGFEHARNQQQQLFAGYLGKKSLVVNYPKKKERTVAAALEGELPLDALGLAGRYHLALIRKLGTWGRTVSAVVDKPNGHWQTVLTLAGGQTVEIPFYVGVKTEHAMSALDLKNMLYGGLLGPLKKIIRETLAVFYRITGNYGFAIILLTIAFQVLLLPFTVKNLKFSSKMKELAPKIQQLQQKFKNDPQKMNAETMQLYRSHGTNPLGGCLVMLLQMPIFIALYGALNDSYELYGADFILWIKNLAAHDPTYILPILMGLAMFVQSKRTQAVSTDPSQKIFLYVMPVMFTFMFLRFPSGLVLYWLTSNVISLGLTVALPKILDKIS
ncbi:MAG: membrane protein insertase YidC [Elusimicrobia bacterium]|nr:membrane protein insertase YidC [Elusimicrobiota bacterium]